MKSVIKNAKFFFLLLYFFFLLTKINPKEIKKNSETIKKSAHLIKKHRIGKIKSNALSSSSFSSSSLKSFSSYKALFKKKSLRKMTKKYTNKIKTSSLTKDITLNYKNFNDLLIFNCTKKNYFALTWDDGPQDKITNGILDLLKLKNVTATFFIVARRLLYGPDLKAAQRALKEGHQIASHSWDHSNITETVTVKKNCSELKHQVFDSDKMFRDKLGVSPKFFRPPYGEIEKDVAETLKLWGYYIPIWNSDTWDWSFKGLKKLNIVKTYEYELKNKDKNFKKLDSYISLQHDIFFGSRNVEATIERYSIIIDLIKEKGYKLVSVAECVGREDDMYFKKKIDYDHEECTFDSDL